MPVKIKSKTGLGGVSVDDVFAKYKGTLGDDIGSYGGLLSNRVRIPSGLFPLDLALGGGFPKGQCSIIYGPEDSGKSSVAYCLIANHQRLWPDEKCVYIAIEPFDPIWAKKLGVNVSKLLVLYPLFSEEAADMAGDLLEADDVGLVILDSIAAMITTQESEKSAEGHNPGTQAIAVGKLCRRTAVSLRFAERQGRSPTLIYVNQTRFKIGVMYGNPETMPGGNAPLFQAQMIVRFYGKAVKDNAISDKYPIIREINFMVKKFKMMLAADNGVASMVTYPHNNLNPGDTDDYNTVIAYLKEFNGVTPLKKGYHILDDDYPTYAAFKARLYKDKKFGASVRDLILKSVADDMEANFNGLMSGDIAVDEDGVIIDIPPEVANAEAT